MTTASTDRQRLKQAREVIHENRPDKGSSNAVYAAYVAVIAALVYGIPAVHAFFAFVDPAWTAQHLTGLQGALVLGGAGVGLLLLAYRLGSIRGPVVPDLPYLDQVAGSALDRAVVLRHQTEHTEMHGARPCQMPTIVSPPFKLSVCPVTNPAVTKYSMPCAISSGSAQRCKGIFFIRSRTASIPSFSIAIGLVTPPGAIAFTVILCGASSFAHDFVKPRIAAFAAQ